MKSLSLIVRKLWPRLLFFSEVGQTSRSKSRGQKLWYHVKGLVTRNTYVQYKSTISSGKKVMSKVTVFQKEVKLQGQGHEVKQLWYHVSGQITRNTLCAI